MDQKLIKEARHTFSSYSFGHYCTELADVKRKNYFSENFNIASRDDAFGPSNGCKGKCEGTGWVPVSQHDTQEPMHSLYKAAELDKPSVDGWHFVPCPSCNTSKISEGLDEHIVKSGDKFTLRSKKSNKDLGSYTSKKGVDKREKQVEYFKSIKEDTPPTVARDTKETSFDEDTDSPNDQDDDANSSSASDDNGTSDPDPHAAAKKRRAARQANREKKKLLPYEFDNQKDANKTGKHLGINGSHISGSGIYKPGSSDFALRDAVARKKAKEKLKSGKAVVSETAIGFENLPDVIRRIKEAIR